MANNTANTKSAANAAVSHVRVYYGLVGLVALVVGVWQIQTSLRLPFSLAPSNESANTLSSNTNEPQDTEALKRKDSDSDGLSDYDELYLYHTSSYLKDTDSDGYEDKTEVSSGNDPLCPHGQPCTAPMFATSEPTSPLGGTQLPANLTAAELRTYLKKAGVTDADLAKYDDATLLQLYHELAATDSGTITPGVTTPPSTPTLTPAQRDEINKLSGVQLRQYLVKAGADAALLDKYDDATLKSLVLEMLNSSTATPTTPSP